KAGRMHASGAGRQEIVSCKIKEIQVAAQKGRELLLKLDSGGSFASVAGLRSRQIALNARIVDTTNADSAGGWRELLAGAGVRTASVSGGGVFRDAAADETIRAVFFAGEIRAWQVV